MPSDLPVPTITTLLNASAEALKGLSDPRSDTRAGSGLELLYGPTAILFAQEAQRDRDMYRAAYFDTAEGADLRLQASKRFGIDQILAGYGTGFALLSRASGTGGTIFAGTRILLTTSATLPSFYVVTTDTTVTTETFVTVPVRATFAGSTSRVDTTTGAIVFDALWDNTWQVARLHCDPGSDYEEGADFRGRVRKTQLDKRPGYPTAIKKALVAAGASKAVLFSSDYNGSTDYGINVCYVGDAGGSGSQTLVDQCQVALDSVRVLGADLMVLGMAPSLLQVTATVTMSDNPGAFDLVQLDTAARSQLKAYFLDPQRAAAYKVDGLKGALRKALGSALRDVTFTSPASDATLSSSAWPSSLPLNYTTDAAISLTYA